MAFGQPTVGIGGGRAGTADVTFRANVGQFRADVSEARQVYQRSTGQMSDAALRMAVAQEKLDRAIHKYGAESRQAKQATLEYRREMRSLEGQVDRTGREVEQTQRRVRNLRGSVVGLAAAYVGTTGLITLMRSSVNAAREEELVLGQTKVALDAAGVSYDQYAEKLERQIRLVQQLGFDDEELAKSFQTLVRSADSAEEAIDQLGLVAGLSRGRYIDLAAATGIVNKANLGMVGPLRRIGIDLDNNAKKAEIFAALQREYGRAAVEAADSGVASADRFAVAVENIQEAIGRGALPSIVELSDATTEWLDKAENQEELQRRVNQAFEAGEIFVRGLGDAFDFLDTAIVGPLKSLGILDEVITAVLIGGIVKKSGLAALGMKGIGVASVLAGRQVATSSAGMVTSLNSVTTAAGRAAFATGAIGAGGAVGAGGRLRGALGALGFTPGGAILTGAALAAYFGIQSGRKAAISATEFQRLREAAGRGEISHEQLDSLPDWALTDAQKSEIRRLIAVANARPPKGTPARPDDRGGARGPGAIAAENATRTGGRGRPRRTMEDILLDEARAAATADPTDDLVPKRERRDLIQRQIDNLERRESLTKAQKERLARLYGELAGVNNEINSIIEAGERKLAEQREAAQKRRKAAREAEERRMDKILDAAEKTAAERGKLLAGTGGNRQNMRRQALRHVDAVVKDLNERDSSRGPTNADVRRELLDLIRGLSSLREFGSNFAPDPWTGQIATHAHAQTELIRDQNREISKLVRGAWHPGTRYAEADLSVLGMGVGF